MEQKEIHQGTSSKPSATVDCLPPQTNTLVFRSHASSSTSAYYQYAFQSASGDLSTRLLTWTVKDGKCYKDQSTIFSSIPDTRFLF